MHKMLAELASEPFHQVALYVGDHDLALALYQNMGYTEWVHDEAILDGYACDDRTVLKGRMSFAYNMLEGKELEILTYETLRGQSHHELGGRVPGPPFISHLSAHTEDIEQVHLCALRMGLQVIHSFQTFNHTNPAIAGKRRFAEAILGTRHILGYDIKFIERIFEGPHTVDVGELLS
jgi:hypothetical protein